MLLLDSATYVLFLALFKALSNTFMVLLDHNRISSQNECKAPPSDTHIPSHLRYIDDDDQIHTQLHKHMGLFSVLSLVA